MTQMCIDSAPTFLGIFDPSIAPPFFYYAYIPIILLSLFFGFFVFSKDRKGTPSQLLLSLSIVFSLSIVAEIIQWIAVPAGIVLFGWQVTGLFQVLISVITFWFVYVFLEEKDLSLIGKRILVLLILPICILLATPYNTPSFDLINCEASNGPLWYYIYFVQIALFVSAFAVAVKKFVSLTGLMRTRALILTIGVTLLGFIHLFTYVIGDTTGSYTIYLFTPLGMLLFISVLTYLIVQYKSFNIRLLGSQALLTALWMLLCAILFIRTVENVRIVLGVSLIVFLLLSIILSRSIKKLDEQKRQIEKLAHDLQKTNHELEIANETKSRFLSIASHQFRSPLTALKGYASLILDGSYGEYSDEMKEPLERIFTSANNLEVVVNDFLNLSRIEQGRMEYTFTPTDFKDLVQSAVDEQQAVVHQRGNVSLTFYAHGNDNFEILLDPGKIKQVVTNMIDNAIKYTPEGSVEVHIEKNDEKNVVRFWTKDTGVGIASESLSKIFEQFTRATNANRVNVMGTGLGMYIAKQIVEEHGGRIWAESDGEGKGSKFTVELPIKKA